MSGLIVVKCGSETVADAPGVNQERLDGYAGQLWELAGRLIVVSSGSVMAGKAEAPEIEDEQILAGLGSANIVMGWKQAFGKFGIRASQVPVTDHEIDDPQEGATLKEALRNDLKAGIVPIINTNDKLSHTELKRRRWNGENDGLAAHVGMLMRARNVIFMTKNVEGLLHEEGLVSEVLCSTASHAHARSVVDDSRGKSRGGMESKVNAAIELTNAGIEAYIAQAGQPIEDILSNQVGTHFVAKRA